MQEHLQAEKPSLPYAEEASGEVKRGDSAADAEISAYLEKHGIAEMSATLSTVARGSDAQRKIAVLESLADKLLAQELITPIVAHNDDIFGLYYRFTEQLVDAFKYESVRARALPIFSRYEALVRAGCDAELKNCRNLDFFRKVENVRDIFLPGFSIAGTGECQDADGGDYYNRLYLAYALSPRGTDEPALDILYLKCALPRLAALSRLPAGTKQAAALKRMATELERIVARSERFVQAPEWKKSYAEFRQRLAPEKYVLADQPGTQLDQIIHKLRYVVLTKDADAINDPAFVAATQEANIARNDIYSYDRIQKQFAAAKSPLLANLKIEPLTKFDTVFTIVDAVATRRWSPAMGAAFYARLKKDDPAQAKRALETALKGYAQAMFLKEVFNTNEEMGKFYRGGGVVTASLIQEAVDASISFQKYWTELYARIDLLRALASDALRLPETELAHLGLDAKQLVLASTYMVSFPHMLMMAYYLAERKFDIRLRIFWGYIDINYVDILNYIMAGGQGPWFVYAPGKNPERWEYAFNTYQILHSLYFAFRTETFRVFQVDEEKFLRKVIDTILHDHVVMYREAVDSEIDIVNRYKDEWRASVEACTEERKRAEALAQGKVYVPRYRPEIDFADLDDGLLSTTRWFQALSGLTVSQGTALSKLVPFSENSLNVTWGWTPEKLDMMRLGTGQVIRLVQSILQIYEQFLRDKGLAPAEIQERVARAGKGLQKLQHEQRRFQTLFSQRVDQILMDCPVRMLAREAELFNEYWKAEIEHLRKVYRDKVKVLRGEAKYEDLIANYKVKGYESIGYTGQEDFSGTHYVYTALDAHVRVKDHLARIAPYIVVNMPTPEEMQKTWVFRGFGSNELQWAKRVNVGFFGRDGQLVSEDEFVRAAIAFGGDPTKVSDWKFFSWEMAFVIKQVSQMNERFMHSLAIAYKMGEVETYPAGRPECLAVEQPADCKITKRGFVTADDLVREQGAIAQMLSVKPGQKELYELRGLLSLAPANLTYGIFGGTGYKVHNPTTVGTLMDPRNGAVTGFYDYPHHFVTAPINGIGIKFDWDTSIEIEQYDPQRKSVENHLKDYYKSQVALEFIPFQLDKDTGTRLNAIYKNTLKQEVGFVRNLEAAIERQRLADEQQGYRRQLRRTVKEEPYFGPYLTPRYPKLYNERIREFHQSTKGFFADEAPEKK